MKLRQGFVLIVLVLLGGTLCRGQTSFVTGNLTAVGAVCATSPPANASHISISTIGFGGATFTLSGTFVGTVGFYGSGDGGATWQPLNVTPSNSTTPTITATAAGLFQTNVSAYTNVCILTLAYTSGTVAARIHISSISARAGGGGGGGGSGGAPSGSVPGQILGVGTSGVVAVNPGLLDSTASPIAGGAYTPGCTTGTNTGDRGRVMVITATATITIPASGAAGCANSIFYFLAQAAATFNASPGDTFDIYNGNPPPQTGATTYSVAAGQYVTVDNGSGTNWHFLVEGPAGSGGTPALSSLTSATAPQTLSNAAYTQTWNWADTNNGPSFAIGESAPSTGGVITGNVNAQSILQVSTAAGSTASPVSITQGTLSGTNAPPALQVQTTWNNAALAGQGLVIQTSCTACAAGSNALNVLNAAGSSNFSVTNTGAITANGNFSNSANNGNVITQKLQTANVFALGNTTTTTVQGGGDTAFAGALGAGIFRGGDNSSTVAAAASGAAILRSGTFTGGLPAGAAMEGVTEVSSSYFGTGVAALGDVVCATTTQFQVTDCPTSQLNLIGVATGTTANVIVVTYGTVPVKLTAAGTLGHTVCMSTVTAGQATDSGGTAPCPTAGAQVGVIVATAGNVVIGNNASTATVALSTTLPLVQLHIR